MARRAPRKAEKPLTITERLKTLEQAVVKLQGTVQELKDQTPVPVKIEPTTNPALLWLGKYPHVGDVTKSFVMYHVGASAPLPILPVESRDISNINCLFVADPTTKDTMLRLATESCRWAVLSSMWPHLTAMSDRSSTYVENSLRQLGYMVNNAYGYNCK